MKLIADFVDFLVVNGALLKNRIPGRVATPEPKRTTTRPKPRPRASQPEPPSSEEDVEMEELASEESEDVVVVPVTKKRKGKAKAVPRSSPPEEIAKARTKRNFQESPPKVAVSTKRTRVEETAGLDFGGVVVEEETDIKPPIKPVGMKHKVSSHWGQRGYYSGSKF